MNKTENEQDSLKNHFDEEFYLEQLQGEKPDDLLEHYASIGVAKGLDPSPFFSTEYYLLKHEDVRKSAINPFEHYIFFGKKEGRQTRPSKRVNAAAFLLAKGGEISLETASLVLCAHQKAPMIENADESQLYDYMRYGWRNHPALMKTDFAAEASLERSYTDGYSESAKEKIIAASEAYLRDHALLSTFSDLLDAPWYAQQCLDAGIATAKILGMDPATHYLAIGRFFRLSPTPLFDVAHYVDSAEAATHEIVAPEKALIHYLRVGESNGLRPCALFNPAYYAAEYDVSEGSALAHFAKTGAALDYHPSVVFWTGWYRATYKVSAVNPLSHFYMFGIEEGCLPNPLLDLSWCANQSRSVEKRTALKHYISTGFLKDLAPHPLLDPDYIRQQSGLEGLIKDRSETAVEFYMRNARKLDPSPLFDTRYYLGRLDLGDDIEQPLWHYEDPKSRGPKCPNPYFFDATYNETRPDVKNSSFSPLAHYISAGHREENISVHPLIDHGKLPVVEGVATPLEALIQGKAGDMVDVRYPSAVDTENRSKWTPVALDIDTAAQSYGEVSIETASAAILAHVFYVELLPEVIDVALNVPQPSVLLISTNTMTKRQAIEAILKESEVENWEVRVFENRGRDVAPSFLGFVDRIASFDYAVHIHTKQSRHYGQSFDKWRRYLFLENGGSRKRVEAILKTFEANPDIGALAPADFSPMHDLISWGHNRRMAEALMQLAGHRVSLASCSLEFPSGSMFWFRVKALRGLFEAGLRRYHFDPEAGQVDGTLSHAVERAFFLLCEAEGYSWARFCSGDKLGGYIVTDKIKFARSRLLPFFSTRNPIAEKLPETAPFFCRAVENPRPRINLLIPTADLQTGYAGVSEAIRQFRAIGNKLGEKTNFRIVATDVPFNNMTIPPDGFSVSTKLDDERDMIVVPGFLRGNEPLGLRENDVFVVSAWWSAAQAFDLLEQQAKLFGAERRRIVYLIQDFEPGFYAWSTRWAMAENTYRRPDQTIAVFNTPLLADFMTKRYNFSATQTFHPMINESLLIPEEKQAALEAREKIVLLYARPHAERNCLEMLDAIVFHCMADDPGFWATWRFLAIGENFNDQQRLKSSNIEVLGRLSLDDYRDYLAKSKLGISIMVSPHPSYPPLEMAANGIKVLTNTYEGKDLSTLHENLESFTLFDPAVLAQRLKAMAQAPATHGKPLVDWFFEGGNNLDSVAEAVAKELTMSLPEEKQDM